MAKITTLLVIISSIALSGCGWLAGNERIELATQTQIVKVPLLFCPAPAEIERPALPLQQMTPEELAQDGEVAKAYVAQVRALLGYTKELEKIIENTREGSTAYDEVRAKLLDEWEVFSQQHVPNTP